MADGRFLNHYEADRQYPDINKRTTEADKGMNSDMSVFCTFNLFRGLGEKYSVIFNKEVLEKATSYFAFNDLADLLPGGINASHYDSKKYLDQYRKRIIPGKHARKVITEILATFQGSYKNFDDSVWGYKEIFEKIGVPVAYRQGGSPEIQLYNPTVEDIEAVVIYDIPGRKINDDIDGEELKKELDKFGIPIKYASNIPEVAGQSYPETIFKELDGQKKENQQSSV